MNKIHTNRTLCLKQSEHDMLEREKKKYKRNPHYLGDRSTMAAVQRGRDIPAATILLIWNARLNKPTNNTEYITCRAHMEYYICLKVFSLEILPPKKKVGRNSNKVTAWRCAFLWPFSSPVNNWNWQRLRDNRIGEVHVSDSWKLFIEGLRISMKSINKWISRRKKTESCLLENHMRRCIGRDGRLHSQIQ